MGKFGQVASEPSEVIHGSSRLVAPNRAAISSHRRPFKFFELRTVFRHIHKIFFIHKPSASFFVVTVDGNSDDAGAIKK
jgi:hypothetical protein